MYYQLLANSVMDVASSMTDGTRNEKRLLRERGNIMNRIVEKHCNAGRSEHAT